MNEFYNNNIGIIAITGLIIGFITIYLAIIQPILNYTKAQRKLNKDKRFEIYHNQIDHFAGANGTAKLDRQIAIVFELRRFPEYYPVTNRILADWIEQQNNFDNPHSDRLVSEMKLTVDYINSSWFKRKFQIKN